VIAFRQYRSRPRRRIAVTVWSTLLAAGLLGSSLLGTSLMVSAQDQSAAIAKDAIFARKTVMSALSDKMDQIESMISVGKIKIDSGHDLADTISVMFMAFPHLFPPSTNQWKPNADLDPASDTFASPDVWAKFPDFYQRAASASKIAFSITHADKEDEFKARVQELRVACNACHALYLKTQ